MATEADQKKSKIIAFINRNSGGLLGTQLFEALQNEQLIDNVYDLGAGGPQAPLEEHARTPGKLLVICCGGDGTFNWVASSVLSIRSEAFPAFTPDLVVCPLGTGNDLSRSLGWGRRFPGFAQLPSTIQAAAAAHSGPQLDVWRIDVSRRPHPAAPATTAGPAGGAAGAAGAGGAGGAGGTGGGGSEGAEPSGAAAGGVARDLGFKITRMHNYFSIGIDAEVARRFHEARQTRPWLFRSQLTNKVLYGLMGGALALEGSPSIDKRIETLFVGGEAVTLPKGTKALVVLNIPSYAAGTDPWGTPPADGSCLPSLHRRRAFAPPAADDGLLEVFCLHGVMQVGLMQNKASLYKAMGYGAKRLGQGSTVRIQLRTEQALREHQGIFAKKSYRSEISAQVDGEAWGFDSLGLGIAVEHQGRVGVRLGPEHKGNTGGWPHAACETASDLASSPPQDAAEEPAGGAGGAGRAAGGAASGGVTESLVGSPDLRGRALIGEAGSSGREGRESGSCR